MPIIGLSYCPVFENLPYLEVSFLKENGLLYQEKSGTITWRSVDSESSAGIESYPYNSPPCIILDYLCKDEPVRYKIELVTVPSNLGLGEITYFKCPATGFGARKLYRYGKYFLHRKTYRGVYYLNQTQSRRWREYHRHIKRGGIPYYIPVGKDDRYM